MFYCLHLFGVTYNNNDSNKNKIIIITMIMLIFIILYFEEYLQLPISYDLGIIILGYMYKI